MDIALIGNTTLRSAIQRNLVSFPAQIPAFNRRRSDRTQERIVQLYFVRGWRIGNICARYRLSKAMVQKLLSEWRIRAIAAGYIQNIHPDVPDGIARSEELSEQKDPAVESGFVTPEPGRHMAARPDTGVSAAGGQ